MSGETPRDPLAPLGRPASDRITHLTTWPGAPPCVYRQRIWRARSGAGRYPPALVVATELGDNPGMSVTNCAELVWRDAQAAAPGAVVVEHYGPCSYVSGRDRPNTYDLVTVDNDGRPAWKRVPLAELIAVFVAR